MKYTLEGKTIQDIKHILGALYIKYGNTEEVCSLSKAVDEIILLEQNKRTS